MKERMPMGYWNKSVDELAIAHPLEAANSATGYIRISRGNKILYLHRWLWEMRHGPIPAGYTVDHINGIRTDCRWCNLRCVPTVINLRNSTKRSDNTSGVTLVCLYGIRQRGSSGVLHVRTTLPRSRSVKYSQLRNTATSSHSNRHAMHEPIC